MGAAFCNHARRLQRYLLFVDRSEKKTKNSQKRCWVAGGCSPLRSAERRLRDGVLVQLQLREASQRALLPTRGEPRSQGGDPTWFRQVPVGREQCIRCQCLLALRGIHGTGHPRRLATEAPHFLRRSAAAAARENVRLPRPAPFPTSFLQSGCTAHPTLALRADFMFLRATMSRS